MIALVFLSDQGRTFDFEETEALGVILVDAIVVVLKVESVVFIAGNSSRKLLDD